LLFYAFAACCLQELDIPTDVAATNITDSGSAKKAVELLDKLWLDKLNHAAS
jgi:hypothetical protein